MSRMLLWTGERLSQSPGLGVVVGSVKRQSTETRRGQPLTLPKMEQRRFMDDHILIDSHRFNPGLPVVGTAVDHRCAGFATVDSHAKFAVAPCQNVTERNSDL